MQEKLQVQKFNRYSLDDILDVASMSVIAAPVLVFVYWLVVFTVVDEGDGDGCDDDVSNHNAMKRMTKSKVVVASTVQLP